MILKGIIDEDFVNYKLPSMVLMFPKCSFKCGNVCQNISLADEDEVNISALSLAERYIKNPITKAVVCQGLEPFDTFEHLLLFITVFRDFSNDDIVIYTGYTEQEVIQNNWLNPLKKAGNIVIKYGRYIPGDQPHLDDVLGVKLASDNQYAVRY